MQRTTMRLTEEMVAEFESQEELNRLKKRLTTNQIQGLVWFLVKCGWKSELYSTKNIMEELLGRWVWLYQRRTRGYTL